MENIVRGPSEFRIGNGMLDVIPKCTLSEILILIVWTI